MNARRPLSLVRCQSRLDRPTDGVRAQTVHRVPIVFRHVPFCLADDPKPAAPDAAARFQRSLCLGHFPPGRKQSP
jgi:hypothetical protein